MMRLPIEITAKAVKKVNDNDVPLHFSNETWIQLLNLRFAESDQKLTRKGNSGWCFTDVKNDYSRELQMAHSSKPSFNVKDDGTVIIIMYVYTNDVNTKRIAVSVDTDNGKHFTTADNSTTVEKMSVTVTAKLSIDYLIDNISVDWSKNQRPKKVSMHYNSENGASWSKEFDAHYDNVYIKSKNINIKNYSIHGYGPGGDYPLRISSHWTNNNNQHMLIANPENLKEGESTLGFYGKATFRSFPGLDEWVVYDLFRTFKYNDWPKAICWTHFFFAVGDAWPLTDGVGLKVNDTNIQEYHYDSWFEFYDDYLNYGEFNIFFFDKSIGEIHITKR